MATASSTTTTTTTYNSTVSTPVKIVQGIFMAFVFALLGILAFGTMGSVFGADAKNMRRLVIAGILLGGVSGFTLAYNAHD